MFAALLAAAFIHAAAPAPPAVQLAGALRAATFRVLLLPPSMRLLRAEGARDGSRVRVEYSVEGAVIDIDERPALATDLPAPDEQTSEFDLEGYAAVYRPAAGYRGENALAWYRPDLTVVVSSRDAVNEPLLVDVALGLR